MSSRACMSREALHEVFRQQQLIRSFSLSGGLIKFASLYVVGALYRHKMA